MPISRLRAVLIYGYKHKYLYGSLTTCPFSNNSSFPSRVYNLLSHGPLMRFSVWSMNSLLGSRPQIQSESHCPDSSHVPISPVGTSCCNAQLWMRTLGSYSHFFSSNLPRPFQYHDSWSAGRKFMILKNERLEWHTPLCPALRHLQLNTELRRHFSALSLI